MLSNIFDRWKETDIMADELIMGPENRGPTSLLYFYFFIKMKAIFYCSYIIVAIYVHCRKISKKFT